MDEFDKIKKILTSQFETDLFEASIASLQDKNNKLRYNNFAYSIRELSRHFLHSLSPESNIKRCSWYKTETTDDKPTRAQRIKYAIQGGIRDEILEEWGFDIDELKEKITSIKKAIDSLSKYTHINADVFNLNDEDIEKNSFAVLTAFKIFVETIDNYKEQLKQFLDGHIEEHMITSVVSNFFENVDRLAPHHSLNYSEVSAYHISEINDQEIIVDVSGHLHVTLEYGSNKERREGDGLDLEESFPFDTKIKYEIEEDFPSSNYEIEDYDVDTSEWYGDDDRED
ncbi:MAG: hypothetical protein ABIN36_11000 [Ferruginibacter sp.]